MELKLLIFIFALQPSQFSDSISIELPKKNIYLRSNETVFDIEVKMHNFSNENLLLYNFNSETEQAFREESFFCNDRMSARSTILIYDEDAEPICASLAPIPKEINHKPISTSEFQTVIEEEKSSFRKALQVVKKGRDIVMKKKVNVEHFHLEPGVYFIRFLYTSGTSTKNMVSQQEVEEDAARYKAKVFSGCVESNLVKLIVK